MLTLLLSGDTMIIERRCKMQTINDRIGIILEETGQTRTAFAKSLKVSQQYISKLIKTGEPSERLVDDICEKIKIHQEKINKDWILTGQGEMTIKRTRNQEIADFMNDVMELPDKNMKKRLVEGLARLDENDWEKILEIAEKLFKEGS